MFILHFAFGTWVALSMYNIVQLNIHICCIVKNVFVLRQLILPFFKYSSCDREWNHESKPLNHQLFVLLMKWIPWKTYSCSGYVKRFIVDFWQIKNLIVIMARKFCHMILKLKSVAVDLGLHFSYGYFVCYRFLRGSNTTVSTRNF